MTRQRWSLQEIAWGLPLLYIVLSRGGCLERGIIAFLLNVAPSTVRRMVWGLKKRGLVETDSNRVCVTSNAGKALKNLLYVARKRNHYVLVLRGLLIMVSHRSNNASARLIPMELACTINSKLRQGLKDYREIARSEGLPPKTVSYTMKALSVLGCTVQGTCVLNDLCNSYG
jgi:DNA-binding MarR family transcriptional regulator